MTGILVGVDGSSCSGRALEWAAREAAIRNAPLTVLNVDQHVIGYGDYAFAYVSDQELADRARLAAREQTDRTLAQLHDGCRPPSVTVCGAVGLPGDELLKAAEGADLLVVGARGTDGVSKHLLGPVSLQVMRHAHCPVAVIPAREVERHVSSAG